MGQWGNEHIVIASIRHSSMLAGPHPRSLALRRSQTRSPRAGRGRCLISSLPHCPIASLPHCPIAPFFEQEPCPPNAFH